MKVYYNRKSGIIQLRDGRRRTTTYAPDKREEAYVAIRRQFGKALGGVIVDDIKKKLA
jgi:hypothetical protein